MRFQRLRVKSNTTSAARGRVQAKWKEITITKRMSGKIPADYLPYSPQSDSMPDNNQPQRTSQAIPRCVSLLFLSNRASMRRFRSGVSCASFPETRSSDCQSQFHRAKVAKPQRAVRAIWWEGSCRSFVSTTAILTTHASGSRVAGKKSLAPIAL